MPAPSPSSAIMAEISHKYWSQRFIDGHTNECDNERPPSHLPQLIHEAALIVVEISRYGKDFNPKRARKWLIKIAALAVAAVERIDHELATSGEVIA